MTLNPAKLKLAYFSPFNPVQSGISDYSEELLPALAHYAEIDLYTDNYRLSNPAIAARFAVSVYKEAQFSRQAGRYDAVLFHMGNSAAHAYIYRGLQASAGQGVLVLHDFVLHHFLIGEYLNRGRAAEYIRQMARRYGEAGENIAREVIKGKLAEELFSYPLNETALEAARAVVVHSRYARGLIRAAYPDLPVGVARMGVPLPPVVSKAAARARLGLPAGEFIIVSLGHLNPYKRLDSVLWAYRAFWREYPASRLVLVGSTSPNYNVRAMIEALGLSGNVTLTGYASQEASQDYLAAADVCVNLRYPTAGETSASLLRIMGAGRPVLVSRTGAFEELPDEACIKVDVGEAEEELLLEYLRLLASRPALAKGLGRNARLHVARQANLDDAARDYYLFLCEVLHRSPDIAPPAPGPQEVTPEVEEAPARPLVAQPPGEPGPESQTLWQEVAQAAAEIGLDENDPALAEVARAVRFAGSE